MAVAEEAKLAEVEADDEVVDEKFVAEAAKHTKRVLEETVKAPSERAFQPNAGVTLGKWTLRSWLGAGGNGRVWLAVDSAGNEAALKILQKTKPVAYARFRDEVSVLRANADVAGILPVLDASLPDSQNGGDIGSRAWFAMPVARRLVEHAKGLTLLDRAALFAPLADTLASLHARKIAHRDIKPSNLVWHEGRACLCDFGLVDYPGKDDLTAPEENIGPRWTMAPEVRRLGRDADPLPADVYSLAKSLWIVLVGDEKGFDGQYAASGSVGLPGLMRSAKNAEEKQSYWGGLDALLSDSTESDPAKRPTIKQFGDRLAAWLGIARSWNQSSAHTWLDLQQTLFPVAVPLRASWEKFDDVVSVLSAVAATGWLNHMFFPDGGGADLTSVVPSAEAGFIELRCDDDVSVVKPGRLSFESCGGDPEWNYFRLELGPATPIDPQVATDGDCCVERLAEIPGRGYADAACLEEGLYQGAANLKGPREVARYFRGAFVFFQKSSTYNMYLRTEAFDVYDAPHAKMSAEEFRDAVNILAGKFSAKGERQPPQAG
jgi:hypothetical protein